MSVGNHFSLKEDEPDTFQRRTRIFFGLTVLVFVIFFLRLFFLQVIKGPYYREIARKRTLKSIFLSAPRGNIFDRRGLLLAGNVPSFALSLDIKVVHGPAGDEILRRLAKLLGEDFPSLKQRYLFLRKRATTGEVILEQDLDRDLVAQIEARRFYLPGVQIKVEPERYYPLGPKAFHLVGYVSRISAKELEKLGNKGFDASDFLGRTGLEREFDAVLRGKKGRRLVEVDARGRVRKVVAEEPPIIGNSLVLTVDSFIQQTTYRVLGNVAGAMVIMSPRDGHLLALVSRPSVDPVYFVKKFPPKLWQKINRDKRSPLMNKALAAYPPGSTFKVVTAIAALTKGVVTPETTVFCPGYYRLGRRLFRCWKWGGHGEVNLIKALEVSCDVYFYYLGEQVGIDYLSKIAHECGLGELTGLGFVEESPGLIPSRAWKERVYRRPWQKGETLNVAIGQGAVKVTPLQLARLYAAIVNGGKLYRPWCVARIVDPYGQIIKEYGPEVVARLPIPPRDLSFIRKGLVAAVNAKDGTGRAAALKNILVGGKTGTAQIVSMKRRIHSKKLPYLKRDHAWFVAYAPAEAPEIVTVVFIEHGGHGGSVAAPVAKKFLKAYFEGGK